MEKSYTNSEAAGKNNDLASSLAYMGASFLLACPTLFGGQSPLSMVLLAASGGIQTVFALCGGIIGYTAFGSIENMIPHIVAMAAVAALRLIFRGSGRLAAFVSSAAAFVCVLAANAFHAKGVPELFTAVSLAAVSLICTLAMFTLKRFAARSYSGAKAPELISAGMICFTLAAALTDISVMPFNVGVILSAAAVIYVSDHRKGLSSAAGVLCAAGIAAGSGDLSYSCMTFAVSGLLIVLLERYSRLTRACALIFMTGAGALFTGIDEGSASFIVSVLTGALIYAFLPERLIPLSLGGVFPAVSESSAYSASYTAFGRKLSDMSEAIGEMDSAIKRTAQALDKQGGCDISNVYINASEQVCRGCGNNMRCWGTSYNRSADILNKAVAKIKSGVPADETMLSGHFAEICPHRKELSQALNRHYAVFCSARSASRRMTEMRKLLSAQLEASRKLLSRASDELSPENVYDPAAAEKTCALLKEYGLSDPSALAVNIEGTLTIDAYAKGVPQGDIESFSEKLSFALRKSFDPPMILEDNGRTHITVSERSPFDAQIRIFQKSKGDNRQNGDCCDCFNDGKGCVYMILSDGMGSGSRARIDSAFACGMLSRLLKAGIDLDASLEMLNSSLLVKSTDESFATLDICRIDLYSGSVTMYKAGGAETFVRCGNSFAKLGGSGIPFGVSIPAKYTEKSFFLSEGDVVIMTSDGAQLEEEWLEQLVMRERSPDLGAVIDTIGEALTLSTEKGKEDDMTVIGVKMMK